MSQTLKEYLDTHDLNGMKPDLHFVLNIEQKNPYLLKIFPPGPWEKMETRYLQFDENGQLIIVPKPEPPKEPTPEELKAENERLKAEIEALKAAQTKLQIQELEQPKPE